MDVECFLFMMIPLIPPSNKDNHFMISCTRRTTQGLSQAGAFSGSQMKDLGDDNIYDEVPLESSSQSLVSLGKRSSNHEFEIYDEVIINKEYYMMPVDNSEELSDWGSDFDDGDEDFGNNEVVDNDVRYNKDDVDDDDDSGSGSGSYEEYKNTSAMFYSAERDTPPSRRKPALKLKNDSSGGKKGNLHVNIPGLKGIKGCFGMSKATSLPYLATRKSKSKDVMQEPEDEPEYVDPNIADTENYQQPVMPDMEQGLSTVQIKRHQLVKFILESETDYMKLLDNLIKKYELPIRERDLLDTSKIDIIFQGIHKVLDCHVMFNIALSGRMAEWNTEEKIGDILYALFSKSMVLEAYSSYVHNFAKAMDTVRSACKTHLAFAQLLKARRQSFRERVTLHTLMLKPTKRFPQFIDLVQELLKVTPIEHPDRIPLQMALTQLEYLAENLNERRREAELRQKVKQLDASTAHISKVIHYQAEVGTLSDKTTLCNVLLILFTEDDTIVRTKRQRIIMLSDMLLCVSAIKGKKDRMANLITDVKAKYKLKWNVPLCDVEVIEYGPGINIYASPPRTNTTQAKPGQYRQHTGCQEHFADLQHDLAIIGQIAGLVATLRRSYQILDNDKVQKWHKAIQRTIEEESRLANLYWLELSLPAKTGRVNYIYSTDSPSVKAEWLTALNTAILRLAPENNPGWYLPEDNGTGEVAIQRRNMPLLKDNIDLFLLNPKAKASYNIQFVVQSIVTCPDVTDPLPGIHDNYNNLWLLCGGPDSTGFVNVIRVSCASPPQIVESFHVCDSQILCGEFVERTCLEDKTVTGPLSGKFGFPFPTVWLGTQSGKIYIYNGVDSERRYVMSVKLPDSVSALKAVKRKVFASLGDGSLVVFKPNKDGIWDFSKPKAIGLSKLPVMCMTLVAGTLWCGSGNSIHVFDHKKEKYSVAHVIEVDTNVKTTVRHLVCYGIGVWVSLWKQPTIKLYHSETMKHVQDMNIAYTVNTMQNVKHVQDMNIAYTVNTMQNDIDSQFEKTKLNKLYVSCMVAEEGLLWVGTSVGLVLIFPLPRLEGIPLVSGRACVSFHAYQGRVRSLCPLQNNPDAEVTIGPASGKKKRYQLFREHVMRDACVQTDARLSGLSSYAANGPEPARRASTSNNKQSNEVEDDDDDDVCSDEEFSFVDEKPQSCTPSANAVQTHSANLTARIGNGQHTGEDYAMGAGAFVNQIPDLGDTDFVKMMEDFQGFGSSPKSLVPDPPDVSAVLITKSAHNELNGKTGDEKSREQSPNKLDKINAMTKGIVGHIPPSNDGINSGIPTEGEAVGDVMDTFRGRMHSQGQYVKLEDAQEQAKAIGESLDAAMKQGGSDVKVGNKDELQPGSDVTA
ncbi:hypothetical protein QZH41_013838, partial [Actinostola sp. cb2023]